jgi:hypothetical protein
MAIGDSVGNVRIVELPSSLSNTIKIFDNPITFINL